MLSMGKNVIDGDAAFLNRFDYETVNDPITEGHLRCIDIHVVLEGEEIIGTADVSVLKAIKRRLEEDYIGFTGAFQSLNIMRSGVLIVFPEDAHSLKRMSGNATCHVR